MMTTLGNIAHGIWPDSWYVGLDRPVCIPHAWHVRVVVDSAAKDQL